MIPRLYLITYFFKIVLISHIDSKVITFGQIDDVLLKDHEVEKNPVLETTQSAIKLLGEGRCKNIFFSILLNNTTGCSLQQWKKRYTCYLRSTTEMGQFERAKLIFEMLPVS